MNLITILKKSYNHIKKDIVTYKYNKKHFGAEIASNVFKTSFFYYLLPSKREIFEKEQNESIYNYLREKYHYLIEEYNTKEKKYPKQNKKYIWVFWYQGEENAPVIVKKCIESIKKNSLDYEVIVLNKQNIKKYIDIPEVILKKLENGIITLTHFSDLLRMGLLSKQGGIWVDATCYITSNVFKRFDAMELNSNCKNEYKWCAFFIGGKPNIVFSFCYQLLIDYNKEEDGLIEYFLIDHVLRLCYGEVIGCKNLIDKINIQNNHINELARKFNDISDTKKYKMLLNNSDFHKLTYKKKFKTNKKKKLTNYGYFIQENEQDKIK